MAAITPPPGTYNYRGLIITVPNPAASGKGSMASAAVTVRPEATTGLVASRCGSCGEPMELRKFCYPMPPLPGMEPISGEGLGTGWQTGSSIKFAGSASPNAYTTVIFEE